MPSETKARTNDEWIADAWPHYKLPGEPPTYEAFRDWANLTRMRSEGLDELLAEHWPEASWVDMAGPDGEPSKLMLLMTGEHAAKAFEDLGLNREIQTAGMQQHENKLFTADIRGAWQHFEQFRPVFAKMLDVYANRPRTGEERKVDFIGTAKNPLSKQPAMAQITQGPVISGEIRTVTVDGEPFASPAPRQLDVVRRKPVHAADFGGQLDAFPSKLEGNAVGDIVLQSLAEWVVDGRSTLKSDALTLSEIVFPLVYPIRVSASDMLALMGWSPTAKNIKRLSNLLRLARYQEFHAGDGFPRWLYDIKDVETNQGLATMYSIGAGAWWQNGSQMGQLNAWRLSSGLLRPTLEHSAGSGLPAGYWGMADRAIAGIEAALQWGPTSGKGKQGRIPNHMKPIRPGGPGPDIFIPAWQVLWLAGEPVTPDNYRDDNRWQARYSRLVKSLEALGYMAVDGKPAEVGSTIEVVRLIRACRGREAGLVVRASDRFVEAFRTRGKAMAWDSMPVKRLIEIKSTGR